MMALSLYSILKNSSVLRGKDLSDYLLPICQQNSLSLKIAPDSRLAQVKWMSCAPQKANYTRLHIDLITK